MAAAIAAKPDYLVTYDRRHLIEPPEVAEQSSLEIVTQDVVVKIVDRQENDESD